MDTEYLLCYNELTRVEAYFPKETLKFHQQRQERHVKVIDDKPYIRVVVNGKAEFRPKITTRPGPTSLPLNPVQEIHDSENLTLIKKKDERK